MAVSSELENEYKTAKADYERLQAKKDADPIEVQKALEQMQAVEVWFNQVSSGKVTPELARQLVNRTLDVRAKRIRGERSRLEKLAVGPTVIEQYRKQQESKIASTDPVVREALVNKAMDEYMAAHPRTTRVQKDYEDFEDWAGNTNARVAELTGFAAGNGYKMEDGKLTLNGKSVEGVHLDHINPVTLRPEIAQAGARENNLKTDAAKRARVRVEDGKPVVDAKTGAAALNQEQDPRAKTSEGQGIKREQVQAAMGAAVESNLDAESMEGGLNPTEIMAMLEGDVSKLESEAQIAEKLTEAFAFTEELAIVMEAIAADTEMSAEDKVVKMVVLNQILILVTRYIAALERRRDEIKAEKNAAEAPLEMPYGLMEYFNNLDAVAKAEMQKRLKENKPTSFLGWLSFLMSMVSYKPEAQATKS